jgi:4-hydroxy-2-oxoheptanedioate aldolase
VVEEIKRMNRLRQALAQRNGKTLLGAACYFYDPIFLEIAAHVGFDAIWIEMEHAAISFAEAADLCRMATGTGMLTMIRVPDTRRDSILKTAELGPDIIDVPMVDSPEQMNEMVRYARFAPQGARGSFSVSRAVKYGMVDSVPKEQARLNQELCLMAQVETKEAVDRIEELCAVPDIEIFVGPADLSSSYGVPGDTLHPKVTQAVERIVTTARAHGKLLATACAPKDFPFWADVGVDLLFCANDITCLKQGAQAAHLSALQALQQTNLVRKKE